MRQARLRGGLAGISTLILLALVLAVVRPWNFIGAVQDQPKVKPRPPEKPIAMAPDLAQLRITLGLKDKEPTPWDGSISVSEGKIVAVEVPRGNAKRMADGKTWRVRSARKRKRKKVNVRPLLRVSLDAPLTAKVSVRTKQGDFEFVLGKVPLRFAKKLLKGRATVQRLAGAIRFARPDTEDDYPVLAAAKNGVWLVYNEYTPGPKLVKERVLAGNWDLLVPKGNGDQIRLKHFDGKTWQPSIPVTSSLRNVWRPTLAVDGKDNVTVAWAEQRDGNWDIYYRTNANMPGAAGKKAVRLTDDKGSDFHVVATTDSNDVVWLAWQAWRGDHFVIYAAAVAKNHALSKPQVISKSKTNNWSPEIAADSKGVVYICWDAYDGDSYNVHLATIKDGKVSRRAIADSPRFEARPHIVCDEQDRLWIAYEYGDEQWGKDYATKQILKINDVPTNPGNGLYLQRTVRVVCLNAGELQEPAGDLQQAFGKVLTRNKSVPRLAVDKLGGVWLLVRHHPNAGGGGEVWNSFALRHYGKDWTKPQRIADSANLLDNRPALAPFQNGVLTVYSGDDRVRSANRKQNDLFALSLQPLGKKPVQHRFSPVKQAKERKLKAVHPNEAADVARIRKYRIEHGGKKLQLYRGEFHRHTEFTAHRDQDGLFEDSWRYAHDAGMLDWMGNGDHDNGFGHEYPWWQIQKYTDIMHNPPHFVAAVTYERSNRFPNGHRNVIMPKRGIRPLMRGNLKGTAEKGTPDTKKLYAYLKHFGGICASHTSGTNMGTDWRDNDPVVEPIVEIYQGHRHNYEHFGAPRSANKNKQIGGYQPSGFVWNAFGKGYKMGFQASSDHVSTHMSYAVVLTDDISRQGMIDAFKRRHCYAATDNIIMDVTSGKQLMGDIFKTDILPTLKIKVLGTEKIAKLHVVRNNEYVYSVKPMKQNVDMKYTDMKPMPGRSSYYYVRIEQTDGNIAWASPMWITYTGKK